MNYFARRNKYVAEHSGHEEASAALRRRILRIYKAYLDTYGSAQSGDLPAAIQSEFPDKDPFALIKNGSFHEVFTAVEIFVDVAGFLDLFGCSTVRDEVLKAFQISGSVYTLTPQGRVGLKMERDLAEKIESAKSILHDYPEFHQRFSRAVENLVGRKAAPAAVIKDVFVASETYLAAATHTACYGDAVKTLAKDGLIDKEQKRILEALNRFYSDGAGHPGNAPRPTEEAALWFLDMLTAQVRLIARVTRK